MRTIEWTSAFKRDYKRAKASPRHRDIDELLTEIVGRFAEDKVLPEKQRDHNLGGNWKDHVNAILSPTCC